jgi:hypothetical protein
MSIATAATSSTANSIAPIPIKSAWLQKTIENLVVSFKSEETRQWLQVFIVDPVIQYIMEKSFPYVIIIIVIIAAIILLLVSTFLLVFFRTATKCKHCETLMSAL